MTVIKDKIIAKKVFGNNPRLQIVQRNCEHQKIDKLHAFFSAIFRKKNNATKQKSMQSTD